MRTATSAQNVRLVVALSERCGTLSCTARSVLVVYSSMSIEARGIEQRGRRLTHFEVSTLRLSWLGRSKCRR
jgi:hypothetical protein